MSSRTRLDEARINARKHQCAEWASDMISSSFLTELPPPRTIEVLWCGVTLDLRLMVSSMYLTEPTFLGDLSFPFFPEYKRRWGCGHLSLLTWAGNFAPPQLRFVTQTRFGLLCRALHFFTRHPPSVLLRVRTSGRRP